MTAPKRPRDPNQLAKFIVDVATGEKQPEPSPTTDAALPRGRAGGLVGGVARAASLTPDERKKLAKSAAKARWVKEKQD